MQIGGPLAGELVTPRRPARVTATRHEQHDATVLGDVRLRYIDVRAAEEGGPPLVLLHGIASRIEEYEDLIESLRPGRRIIVMDLPATATRTSPHGTYTLAFLEDAVLGLLDRLDVKEADLAGGSLGGNLVLRLGHRCQSRFRRLASWAPAGAWEPMRALGLVGSLLMRARGALFWPSVWVQSRFWYHPRWPGRSQALREAFAHYREIHEPRVPAHVLRDRARAGHDVPLPNRAAIRQQTLVLWGDQDRALGMREGVKRLVQLMPDARLSVFPGRVTRSANEVPDELARRIDAFLTSG